MSVQTLRPHAEYEPLPVQESPVPEEFSLAPEPVFEAEPDTKKKFVLELQGDTAEFELTGVFPQWMYIKLAWATRQKDENAMIGVMYDMFRFAIVEEDFDRLEGFLSRHEFDFNVLFDKLTDAVGATGDVPLDERSTS